MKYGFFVIASILGSLSLRAQDLHFSQYYAAPIALNPALTGKFEGLARFGGNYRAQWWSVTVPFQTVSVYGDVAVLRNQLGGGWLGIGCILANDQAGDGDLTVTKVGLSAAYHLPLTVRKNFYASMGFSGLYIRKRIDFTQLTFDNQWNSVGFDSNIDPGERMTVDAFGYWDIHAGLALTYTIPKRASLQVGFSMIHIGTPEESFLNGGNVVHRRSVAHAYSMVRVRKDWTIQPGASFMYQRKAQEFQIGSNVTCDIKAKNGRPVTLYFGLWGRAYFETMMPDALFPLVGAEYRTTRFLATYDVNISKLVPGSYTVGAVEISIVHVIDRNGTKEGVIRCPFGF